MVEIGLVLAVMLRRYHPRLFAAIIVATFLSTPASPWCSRRAACIYQRRVNKLDSRAKGQLADSLINYGHRQVLQQRGLGGAEVFGHHGPLARCRRRQPARPVHPARGAERRHRAGRGRHHAAGRAGVMAGA
jgi:hypothetical protein